MGAAFPNAVANFTPKHDFTDVNFAADINRLQDEIVAIEQTLGALVTSYNSTAQAVQNEANAQQALQQSVNGLATNLAAVQQQENSLQTQITTNFATLADALAYGFTGNWMTCAQLTGGTVWIQQDADPDFDSHPHQIVNWGKPTAWADPDKIYNGRGFTLNKSGFWLVSGYAHFVPTTKGALIPSQQSWFTSPNQNIGEYEAMIVTNGGTNTYAAQRSYLSDGLADSHPVQVTTFGWFPAGTTIDLALHHNAKIKQHAVTTRLSAICLRESGTKWTQQIDQTLLAQQAAI